MRKTSSISRPPRTVALLTALAGLGVACDKVLDLRQGVPAQVAGEGGRGGSAGSSKGGRTGGGTGGTTKAEAGTGAGAGRGSGGRGGRAGSGGADTNGNGGRSSSGTAGTGEKGGATGHAGNGGELPMAGASDGGEAGEEPTGECTRDEDCESTDPDCDMVCRSTLSGKLCVAVGADRDHDQQNSAACGADPGLDCDDTRPEVYAGAPELCDGLDNDCDGSYDMDEGRTLTGQTRTLVDGTTTDADVAWSPSQQTWGLLWSADDVWYQPLTRDLDQNVQPFAVSPNDTGGGPVSIAWGNDTQGAGEFGIAYTVYPDVSFSTIAVDGTWGVPEFPLSDQYGGWGSDEPDVAWQPSTQTWILAWNDLRDNTFQPILRTVSTAGVYGPEVIHEFGTTPRIASLGDSVALVWPGWPGSQGLLYSDTLAPLGPLSFSGTQTVESPVVASGSGSFGVAGRVAPDKVTFTEFEPTGAVRCGPVTRDVGSSFVPSTIIAKGDRFAIFSARPSVQVLEILPGCKPGQLVELEPESAHYVRAAQATDGGILVMWGGSNRALEGRVMGPHFCD